MMHMFQGNPLQAEDYCYTQKLNLVIPSIDRDNSEILGVSDVVDLMVQVALSEGETSYRIGIEFTKYKQIIPHSLLIYWSEFESQSGIPHRNLSGFSYYDVQVLLTPLHPEDGVMMLGEFLSNPVIRFTTYYTLERGIAGYDTTR